MINILKNKKFKLILRILFFLELFQNCILLVNCSNYISMKLKNYNNEYIKTIPDNNFTFEHFINNTINNLIYTSIKIGTPSQTIKTWINSDELSYFLYKDICILDSYFNENISTSFETNESKTFYYNGYGTATYINETIILENNINETESKEIKINKFPIMFMKDPKNDKMFKNMHSIDEITGKTCATIGFKYIGNYNDNNSKDFTITLKAREIIDDYTVFIEFDENGNEKYLILGGYPEEIFENKYNAKNQNSTYIHFYYQKINQWGLSFNKVALGEEDKLYEVEAGFHYNLGVIYGVESYQSYIEKHFFQKYIDLKICEKNQYKDYTGYSCNKEKFTIEEMRKFPEIKFTKNDLEESFVLTYEDLFFNKGDKIYFLVVFHRILKDIWELGKPFLKKYTFAFNFDSKLIWYYKRNKNGNKNDIKTDNKLLFKDNFIFICIIIILSLILGLLFFLLGRMIYNHKKKVIKAEELNEEIDYEAFNNKNIN